LNFEQSVTYDLPFGPGKRFMHEGLAGRIVGGWKLAATVSIVSGTPFTVTANGGTINTPGQTQTANLVGVYKVPHHIGPGKQWFDPSSFAQPVGCTASVTGTTAPASPTVNNCPIISGITVGNTGRNAFYGPGFIQDNLSVFKTFPIYESVNLETRLDVFQLSNTPQFSGPNTNLASPSNFGQVTSTISSGSGVNGTGGGRALQLAGIIRF